MSNFTWVEIYKEIVEKIKDKNTEDLVNLLKDCENCQINYLKDHLNIIKNDLETELKNLKKYIKDRYTLDDLL